MRKEFVAVKTRKEAKDKCPWFGIIKKAEGGYWCFESEDAYEVWKNQK